MSTLKFVIYLVLILFISSCTNKNSEEYQLRLNNKSLHIHGDSLFFTMENKSHDEVIFIEDLSEYHYFKDQHPNQTKNHGFSLKVLDENNQLASLNLAFIQFDPDTIIDINIQNKIDKLLKNKELIMKKYAHLLQDYDSAWVFQHAKIIENAVIISKNQQIEMRLDFIPFYTKESYLFLKSSGFELNQDKQYYAQLRLEIDSVKIYKHLTNQYLDSLESNNIKIFHGSIESNKIPLKFH